MTELRRRRLPVSTIGFGAESLSNDVEVDDLELTPKTLAKSRLEALVTLRQNGFTGKRAKLTLLSSGSVMATREIVLQDRAEQTEKIEFNAGQAGVKNVEVRLQPMEGETNRENNSQTRVLSVDDTKRRLLYVEGEPRWEYQVPATGSGGRSGSSDRLHATDNAEQSVPAGHCEPARAGRWVSDQGRKTCLPIRD